MELRFSPHKTEVCFTASSLTEANPTYVYRYIYIYVYEHMGGGDIIVRLLQTVSKDVLCHAYTGSKSGGAYVVLA